MTVSSVLRCAFGACAAVAALAGCGSSLQSQPPAAQPAAAQSSYAAFLARLPAAARAAFPKAVHPDGSRSWMAKHQRKNNLLYIVDEGSSDVYVYSYKSHKLRGTLTGLSPTSVCTDNKGDVFVTSLTTAQIFEFAHGGTTPIATLSDPGEDPFSCAVDNKTGTIAVTNLFGSFGGPGSLSIYQSASATPTNYSNPFFQDVYYVAYDNSGNLFLDGISPSDGVGVAELPSGGTTLAMVNLGQATISWPGGVAWDGQYITVGDQNAGTVLQLTVSNSAATVAGTTTLANAAGFGGYAVPRVGTNKNHRQAIRVIAPACSTNSTAIYAYPGGGNAIDTIAGSGCPSAAVVSKGVP